MGIAIVRVGVVHAIRRAMNLSDGCGRERFFIEARKKLGRFLSELAAEDFANQRKVHGGRLRSALA